MRYTTVILRPKNQKIVFCSSVFGAIPHLTFFLQMSLKTINQMFDPKFKVYVRGLELFGKLDSETINNLFGNLDEVIRVNDGLEDELNKLRDDRGKIHLIRPKFSTREFHILISRRL